MPPPLLASGTLHYAAAPLLSRPELVPQFAVPAHGSGAPIQGGPLPADVLLFATVGLLAGAHCLGMCGPLVTLYGDRMASDARDPEALSLRAVGQHALFNLGRAASYAVVGALFALAGGALFASTDAVAVVATPVRAGLGLLVGGAIVAIGAFYLVGRTDAMHALSLPGLDGLFQRVSGVLTAHVDRLVDGPGIAALGAVHGLLPCPIIYPAYLYAFALGDPVRAALLLGVLGLGTVPTLFVYGTFLTSLSTRRRALLHRAMGVGFLVLGYVPVSHALVLLGVDVPHLDVPFYQPLGPGPDPGGAGAGAGGTGGSP